MWYAAAMRRVLLFAVLMVGGSCKGDRQKCEDAARNFATLTYWKRADAEIEAAPPDRREAMRTKRVAQFTAELESRIDVVVTQCQSANNTEQIDCMIAAKTADQALECADLVPNK
jgi:hypothetical protein